MAVNNFAATSGEWNTAGNWSLGHVPNNTEDTTFTGLDGSGALTITTTAASCKSADFSTAGAAFTLSGSAAFNIYGSLACKTGMTWSHSGLLHMAGTATGTITSSSVVLSAISQCRVDAFNLTLADAFNIGTKALYVYSGSTLTTGNNNITCGLFSDLGSGGTQTFTLGSSTISCSNLSFPVATNTLTVTANTAAINITSTVDITADFGGKTWGGTTTVLMTGGKYITLDGANTFGNFSISWTSEHWQNSFWLKADQTISGTFTVTGSSTITRPVVASSTLGTARTITAATVTITGAVDFQFITGAGAGSWDLSAIASGNRGGNSGITFRTPGDYYLDAGTANVTTESNCWATSSGGGAGGTGAFPLPQDTIIIDDNSWDDTGNIFTISSRAVIGNLNTSSLTEANTITFSGSTYYYGDLILTGSGLTTTSSSEIYVDGTLKNDTSDSVDIVGVLSGSASLYLNMHTTGVIKLTNDFITTCTTVLYKGTLDLNGHTLTTKIWSNSNFNSRSLMDSAGGGKIVTTGLTGTVFNQATATNLTVSNAPDIDIGTSNLTLTGNVTFAGGGKTFGDFKATKHAGNYTCNVTGANTFGVLTLETPDATYQYSGIKFTAATTTTISSIVADGTVSYQITLGSITAATHTISDSGGTNSLSYVTPSYSIATGGATFNALTADGNVDGGNNTGWIFSSGIKIPIAMLHQRYRRN